MNQMNQTTSLAQEVREIEGLQVEFFKLSQRKFSKLRNKMVAEMSRMDGEADDTSVILTLLDTPFFDLVMELVFPIIRVNGKDISQEQNYETIMSEASPVFEISLYKGILDVYLGKFLTALATNASGSETKPAKTESDVEIRQIGRTGSFGNQS